MPLSIEGIFKAFEGKQVLSAVSHVFPEAGACVITGPSGCGKTTLLRILMGLEVPDAGSVHMPPNAVLSAVFQEDRLILHYSAEKNILLPGRCTKEQAEQALQALGLLADAHKPVGTFSGGMQRRVAIARAVLHRPDILFLDEPFAGLDAQARALAANFILQHMTGGLILLVTHDHEEAELLHCADRIRLGTGE